MNLEDVKFDENGLVPVVVQDAGSGQVLMVAYANKEALEKTIETGLNHFWSRSRQKLWMKGEESGNMQEVRDIYVDCDRDTVLVLVDQKGVACHTGERSCFFTNLIGGDKIAPEFGEFKKGRTLDDVYEVIDDRKRNPREGSYVSGLFEKGPDSIFKKVVEEAAETVIGAKNEDKEEIIYEVTDLLFHTLIALSYFEITPADVYKELGKRFGKSKESYVRKS